MAKKTDALKKLSKLNSAISSKIKSGKEGYDVFKKFAGITEYIDLGNYILNAQMSGSIFGGLPNTRSVELAGESGSGKSFICLNAVRGLTELGYYTYYIDTEGAMEESDFTKFGANGELVNYIRTIKTYSQLKFFMNQLIAQKETEEFKDIKIAVVTDSYGMLNTKKELEDSAKGKTAADMGLRAKEGRQLFRNITLDLSNLAIPFIFTNHTGASLDLFAPDPKASGGDGPTYSASCILFLAKRNLTEEIKKDGKTAKTRTGIIVRSKTHKNRLSRPIEVHFHISFEKGMNRYVGLEEYISWENCGVVRGTILTEEEFKKKYKKGKAVNSTGKDLVTHVWTDPKKGKYYCVENKSAKTYAVLDSLSNINPNLVFTNKMFTQGTLEMLDERVIKPLFKYKDIGDLINEELEDLTNLAVPDTSDDIEAESIEHNEDNIQEESAEFDLKIPENKK